MKKFEYFRIDTLFDIHPTKAYKLTNSQLYATTGNTPILSNSSVNNGIGGYCGLDPTEPGNTITFSDTTTGTDTIFYQPDPFIGYPHVQGLYPKKGTHTWCAREYLYLVALIKCAAGKGWNYSNKFTRKFVSNLNILLPITNSGEIDFEYMQERVKELEQERVKELDAYLKVTGLNDYELTEEDKKVKAIHKVNKVFEIGSLFEKVETKKVQGKANDFPEKETEEYCIPLLTAGIENHGFARYAKKEQCPETISNVISISANGANSGVSFYQPYQFAVLQDAYAVKVKNYTIPNEEVGIYLSAVLNKSLKGTHGWTYKAGWNRVKYEKVSVPIKTDENRNPVIDPDHKWSADGYIPDWDYMQKITKVYEKEVIAGVVKNKDEIIEKTKEIVNKD